MSDHSDPLIFFYPFNFFFYYYYYFLTLIFNFNITDGSSSLYGNYVNLVDDIDFHQFKW